jgi:Flp pilus assembly protein CpaB
VIRTLSRRGWAVLAAVALVCVVAVVLLWKLGEGDRARREAAQARAEVAVATGRIEAGKAATNTVATAAARDAATDTIKRENADAIRSAPGADVPVDPRLADAGRRGLCRYASYQHLPECVQRPGS